jgi:hypothetical protein
MPAQRPEAALIQEIEALLLELRRRLDDCAREAVGDVVAADELFVLAGQLDAVLVNASEHLHALRAQLEEGTRQT